MRVPISNPRRLMAIQEAANHLGVSAKTIRRRIADGSVSGYRTGPRLIRVDLSELEAALLRPIATVGKSD